MTRTSTRPGLLARIADTLEELRLGLCKLNEIQFSAPWRPRRTRC